MVDTVGNVRLLVLLLVITLAVALVSQRLRIPYTLALVIVGLLLGVVAALPGVEMDPQAVVLIFLPALLFEGAWALDTVDLMADRLIVLLLVLPGTLISSLAVAAALHWAAGFSWPLAFLVGATVSPTDPVAVVSLFRQLRMSSRLRTIVEGESLFNDGVGAVLYVIALGVVVAAGTSERYSPLSWATGAAAARLLLGGPLVGIVVGLAASRLLRRIDDYKIEIAVTVTIAYGSFLLGDALQTSGLLAVAFGGLIVGSYGRRVGMSERTRQAADVVWEVVGYVANSLLFLVLGLHVHAVQLLQAVPGIAWAVIGLLVGRILVVTLFVPMHNLVARWAPADNWPWYRAAVGPLRPVPMSWGPLLGLSGIRGALSVALALSLPSSLAERGLLQGIVYGVVLVTLLGQGIALRIVVPGWRGAQEPT